MKQLSFFNANFQNSFQDVVYYKTLGCQTCDSEMTVL